VDKTCETCKHWNYKAYNHLRSWEDGWGDCFRVESSDKVRLWAHTDDESSDPGPFFTPRKDFGCILHEEKN
jgi:hypothetical protein